MPSTGNANAVKVRRVMQVMRDLAPPAGASMRVLDLACGEGVYSIEAGLRGAEVVALDARLERMDQGARSAARLGLSNVTFEQRDVRSISASTHGQFDVILFLGILYHLDVPDVFDVLENLYGMCRGSVIIDTHVSLKPWSRAERRGRVYEGSLYREHDEGDPAELRGTRLLASVDNTLSFWFTKRSLVDVLCATGFTSVLECHAPPEPSKPADRVTLVATKGTPVRLSSYPWLNGRSEDEVADLVAGGTGRPPGNPAGDRMTGRLRNVVNRMLRPLGCEIIRI